VVAAICSPDSSKRGNDLGGFLGLSPNGIIIESSDILEEVIFRSKPDVVVDFSTPQACVHNARIFSKMHVAMVVGTTGFTKMSLKRLEVLSLRYRNGIVYAPNITLGVNVLMMVTNLASNILNNYDFQVNEIHHRYKKDSPSGTAVKIAAEIKKGLAASGEGELDRKIPITSVRAGGVTGKHEVMIIGDDDQILISHESFSRKAFALGAVRAVNFIADKPGFYEMSDVLNLKKVLSDYIESSGSMSGKSRRSQPLSRDNEGVQWA
jgi:4-hydroxy-tetrahydrodipicolinate reductase